MAGDFVGVRFSGRYRATQLIGGGGTSEVYHAIDEASGDDVALKVIGGRLADSNQVKDRFTREVAVLRRLDSPHIVKLRDAGIDEGRVFLVLDLIEGETLAKKLQREKKLSLEETLDIAEDVLEGLSVASAAEVVHRDLKPGNIILTRSESRASSRAAMARILDFGFAKLTQTAAETTTLPLALTKLGMAVGTPYYMSPEQARGDMDVSYAADLYSLGVVMFECLAGRPPHLGKDENEIMIAHTSRVAPDVRKYAPELPPEVAHFLKKALARDPKERFRSAEHMRSRLALLRSSTGTKRWLVPVAVCALAFGVVMTAVAISLLSGCKEKRPGVAPTIGSASSVPAESNAAREARPLRLLKVPASYDANKPSPLVIVLHGFGSDGPSHASMFDFGGLADRERIIVAAPDGTLQPRSGSRFWNAVPACCDFESQRPDDVMYLRDLVQDLGRKYRIDPQRVYAVGHSNGGAMAMRLACDASDVFAAVFSLAGPFYDEATLAACSPKEPVSVRIVHGTADRVVPFEGGKLRTIHADQAPRVTPSAGRIAQFFANTNGCGAPSTGPAPLVVDVARKGPGSEVTRYGSCKNDTSVELWSVAGMGHAWSEPGPAWLGDVWSFLDGHRKKR